MGNRGGWEDSAESWIATQGEEGDWLRKWVLDDLILRLCLEGAPSRLLDVGCGHGRFAARLVGEGIAVVGVDPIQRFLEAGASGDLALVRGVAERLPFGAASFDVVLSYISLVDIADYRTAIAEMARVLTPGGRLVVATISPFSSSTNGWIKDAFGNKLFFPVDNYLMETEQVLEWKGIRIVNYHRPLSALMAAFLYAGLTLLQYLEPKPIPGTPAKDVQDYLRAPYATVLVWRKP